MDQTIERSIVVTIQAQGKRFSFLNHLFTILILLCFEKLKTNLARKRRANHLARLLQHEFMIQT